LNWDGLQEGVGLLQRALLGHHEHAGARVVDQVAADARQVQALLDAVPAQLVGRADARTQQDGGGADRPGGQDHPAGRDLLGCRAVQ